VLSETFRITCEGEIGFINGLALAKRSRDRNELDWEEINAGLGHLFLLFCYLAIKFEYHCVRLTGRQCLGSCSKVRVGSKLFETYWLELAVAPTTRIVRSSSGSCWTTGYCSWSC